MTSKSFYRKLYRKLYRKFRQQINNRSFFLLDLNLFIILYGLDHVEYLYRFHSRRYLFKDNKTTKMLSIINEDEFLKRSIQFQMGRS